GESARGLRSCTTHSQEASSTIFACSLPTRASCFAASNSLRIWLHKSSNSGFRTLIQLLPSGAIFVLSSTPTIPKSGSGQAQLLLRALMPLFSGAWAPTARRVVMVFHSMTSNSTSRPTAFRFAWMNSFIGRGCIWPEPDAEISAFTFTGLLIEEPASDRNLLAFGGSYL